MSVVGMLNGTSKTAGGNKLIADSVVIGQFVDKSTGALNFIIYALDEDGSIYRNSSKEGGWIPLDMRILSQR